MNKYVKNWTELPYDLKCKLAVNSYSHPAILRELSEDEDERVRVRVANNPNTPPELLHNLSRDEEWCVRYSVAYNPNTPPELLHKLSGDKYKIIKDLVKKRLTSIRQPAKINT